MSKTCISGAAIFALGGALGCTAYPTYKPPLSLDCSVDSAYELDPIDLSTAISYGDPTPGAAVSAALTMLPDGARCGNASALQITTHRFNDWGAAASFYGFHATTVTSRDESAYEGMSFWARAPGATGKSFTLVLDDFNTYDATPLPAGSTDPAADPDPTDSNCVSYSGPDGGSQTVNTVDPATGMVISSGSITVTPPNACGNAYTSVVSTTLDWRFYTIPFNHFHQTAMPNRVPNPALTQEGSAQGTSLLTSKLTLLTLRMPKESDINLWIDKLGFYRKKGLVAGADGGADAR